MQALIDELAGQLPADRHAVLVMDRAGCHIARKLDWPDTITPLHLPPYSPELNPAERWFEALHRVFANRIFDTLDDLQDALTAELRPWWQTPDALKRLVGYPWWRDALDGLGPGSTRPS